MASLMVHLPVLSKSRLLISDVKIMLGMMLLLVGVCAATSPSYRGRNSLPAIQYIVACWNQFILGVVAIGEA